MIRINGIKVWLYFPITIANITVEQVCGFFRFYYLFLIFDFFLCVCFLGILGWVFYIYILFWSHMCFCRVKQNE